MKKSNTLYEILYFLQKSNTSVRKCPTCCYTRKFRHPWLIKSREIAPTKLLKGLEGEFEGKPFLTRFPLE